MSDSILNRLAACGVVPVVVIENAADAVPAARALCAGGIDVMEITFRTAAAAEAIAAVAANCPEMLVGAGTVTGLDQCQTAAAAGARFIVSPGFNPDIADWCLAHDMPFLPGCVTPSEIMQAVDLGLKVLKFFPANVYGGLGALKALSGPFGGVKFIPTGGVDAKNLAEYIASPAVHAVGGSWVCPKADIAAGNFARITALCAEARRIVLGYEVAHIGVNCPDAGAAAELCGRLEGAFGFETKPGNTSNFCTPAIEVLKAPGLGRNGHIAIRTNSLAAAIADLEGKGCEVDMETAKYKGERMTAVYLRADFGGFAVHLLQK